MPRQVILLCGPPGSGKTTLARTTGLTVYDRDDPRWPNETAFLGAITLLAHNPDAQAIVIRAGATPTARATAAQRIRATETRILLVDPHTCQERIAARKQTTQALRRQMAGVTQWWATYQPDPPGGVRPSPGKRHPTGDRSLKTPQWRAILAHWNRVRPPDCQAPRCLLPGIPIRYDGQRGPDSLDVGHILGRDTDDRTMWTIEDTRPEHARCNRSAGAAVTNAKRRARNPTYRPATASRW